MRKREELNGLLEEIQYGYHYSENPNDDRRHYDIEGTREIVVRVALVFLEVLLDIRDLLAQQKP